MVHLRSWIVDGAIDGLDETAIEPCRVCVPCAGPCSGAQFALTLMGGSDHGSAPSLLTVHARPEGKSYSRWRLFVDARERFEVLLLHWPVGACTPIHDHAGLGGVEWTLSGRLLVEDFLLHRARSSPKPLRKLISEEGCVALVEASETALHRCSNPGPEPAWTVHIYGGRLAHCHHYRCAPTEDGRCTSVLHRCEAQPLELT